MTGPNFKNVDNRHLDLTRLNEEGLSFLVVMVLLPFLFACSLAGFELVRAQLAQTEAQAHADRLALMAASVLPQEQVARELLFAEVKKLQSPLSDSSSVGSGARSNYALRDLTVLHQRVCQLTLQTKLESRLANLLGISFSFDISASATAQLAPVDTVLILTDDEFMRPGLVTSMPAIRPADPWKGHTGSETLASQYFAIHSPPHLPTPPSTPGVMQDWTWWKDWTSGGGGAYPRWATQACFNPMFTALKRGAISLVDMLLASPDNRLGVIYSPGGRSKVRRISVLREVSNTDNSNLPGGYLDDAPNGISGQCSGSQARWPEVENNPSYGISDKSCLSFAEDADLKLGALPSSLNSSALGNTSGCPSPWGTFGESNSDYLRCCLGLREAVYWHMAHLGQTIDLAAALAEAIRQLVTASNSSTTDISHRKNLAAITPKRLVAMTSYLPPLNEVSALLENATNSTIETTIVVFAHRELSPTTLATLEIRHSEYLGYAKTASPLSSKKNWLKMIWVTQPEDLAGAITQQIFISGRTASLMK